MEYPLLLNLLFDFYEFLGQVGFNGFEVGAEGPISRKNNSSYLANYRYSTLGVMSELRIEFGTGDSFPYYHDLSFNVNNGIPGTVFRQGPSLAKQAAPD